ncbi:MAG: alpha/beta hydrolase [Deltaproteobacteria bacterium]|nr:alpha/beta hydrolase [Deltaproteobacteria bacterium]NNK85385.1 alpha/beta hydrolase [Desulfobacterales bacterium]
MKKVLIAIPIVILLVLVSFYYLFPGATFKILLNMERGVAGLEQKSIDIGKLHIEYLEGGKGEVLILLHGFGANKDNWTRVAKYLTPYFRVIALDLPGFGESSRNMEVFHLGGNSMGGNLAGNYTAKFRKEISSLWLIATAGIVSPQPSELFRMLKAGNRNPLVVKNEEEYDQLLNFIFVDKPFIPGAIKRHLVKEAINHHPLNQIIFKQIASIDPDNFVPLEILLKNTQTKTLILWGDNDRVLHVSGAKILESAMPNAKIVIMKNVGHVPMVEKPEESASIFLKFMEKIES